MPRKHAVFHPARWGALLLLAGLAAGCANEPLAQTPPSQKPAEGFVSSGHPVLDAWRASFAEQAIAAGRDRDAVRAVLSDLSPLARFLGTETEAPAADIQDQAEFAKPVWSYLETAVSARRKANGARKLEENAALFDALEARYRVDREVLVAIWGMETAYGGYIGNFDAANTLSNMAAEGRRQSFAERELMALIEILERGLAKRGDLVSGWAGAMGQTQFMPSTFLAHAEDFEGDGRIDVWGNPADALASAAAYLAASGYQANAPWGIEVVLPDETAFLLADGQRRPVSEWETLGLRPQADGPFKADPAARAELWVPAGQSGPKFLLFENFDVFKTYNRADSYALAVGLLSEGVQGLERPIAPWPKHVAPLSVAEVKDLQSALNRLGHGAGRVDGILGRGTQAALRRFQAAQGFIPDGFATREMLTYVEAAAGAVSPQSSSPSAPG